MPAVREATGHVLDGRYELHAVVGEGAFGRVYKGRDRRLDRVVAVKVIKPWWAEDPAWAETFARETRLLARVSDPGIVQIYDVGHAREGLYYVAEYVDGESLATRLLRGPVSPREACDIAEQLSRALARAHAKRVVHRDIKPANVLISNTGQVKLGDFGVARLAEGSTGGTADAVVGTPRYMAPEQARGLKTGPASDVYSVGIVLYEMLAGAPPFTGRGAVELALSHLHDPPPQLPDGTPGALVKIVGRALAKDPADRYQDGQAMAGALARARRSAPVDRANTPPPPRPTANGHAHPLEPEPRRHRTLLAPKLGPRRNVNPSARRRSVALLALAFMALAAMILGAVLLAPPGRVRVPRLTGLSKPAVLARLHHMPLRTAFTHRHDAAAPGTAIAQVPSPGARATDGSTVRIVLSDGPPPVELPRLVGQDSDSARSILSSLGLAANVTSVPALGVQPGTVTAQSPAAGKYVRPSASVALTVAETPRWRALTSLSGTGGGQSVPFRIRGSRWRVVYQMSFVGSCSFILFCDGPSAQVVRDGTGGTVDDFGMSDGGTQSVDERGGPGVYQLRVTPGSDTTRWSIAVQDYY
jgi:serine/threonine-protein kinase